MQKTVKVTIGSDTRRIRIEEDASFSGLLAELQQLLPTAQKYIIKYKDDEGDLITISTDRELKEAFATAPDGVLRLVLVDAASKREPYKKLKELVLRLVLPAVQEAKRTLAQVEGIVTIEETLALPEPPSDKPALPPVAEEEQLPEVTPEPHQDEAEVAEEAEEEEAEEAEEAEEEEPALQEDVYHEAYCNNCGSDIYNIRYKCANCDDYDLCEECELAWSTDFDIHDISHVFLKIYRPISPSYTTALIDNLYEEKEEEETSDEESSDSDSSSSSDEEDNENETEQDVDEEDNDNDEEEFDDDSDESDSSSSDSEESESEKETDLPVPELEEETVAAPPELPEVDVASSEEPTNVVKEENLVAEGFEVLRHQANPEEENKGKANKDSGISAILRAVQRFLAGSSEPQPSREDIMAFLEAMGFCDQERNQKLLQENDNDVDAVIDQLLA